MRLAWAGLAAITIAAGALQAIVTGQAAPAGAGRGQPQVRPQEPNLGGGIDLDAQDPRIALERLHPADGYEVNLFASEQQFPELANPLAMTFDDRGRLWVLVSPTYPAPGAWPETRRQARRAGRHEPGRAGRLVEHLRRWPAPFRPASSSATAAPTCPSSRT